MLLQENFCANPSHFHCKDCGGRCCTGCELWGDFDLDCSWALPEPCCCNTQQYNDESDSEAYSSNEDPHDYEDPEDDEDAGDYSPFLDLHNLFAASARPVSDKVASLGVSLLQRVAWITQTQH